MPRSKNGPATRRWGVLALALAAVVAGFVFLVTGLRAQESAPQPPQSAGRIDPTPPAPTTTPDSRPSSKASAPLAASMPVQVRIPAIGVDTAVNRIGLAEDGTLAVPQPGPQLNEAAWFENSPTPGQPGASIIEGHVDSTEGPSVFFKLGAVKPGDDVLVTRQDGTNLVFTVDAVRDFQKSSFPTQLVYGAKDLSIPSLRLITCSDFDASLRHHVGNEVVFAHLTKISGRKT